MSYLSTLDWWKDGGKYDPKVQRILFALSERQFKYRLLSTIQAIYDGTQFQCHAVLQTLEAEKIIYIRQHKKSNKVIVGLTQRQDVLPIGLFVYMVGGNIVETFTIQYTNKNTDPIFRKEINRVTNGTLPESVLEEVMMTGEHKWVEDDVEHHISISNTKMIPA